MDGIKKSTKLISDNDRWDKANVTICSRKWKALMKQDQSSVNVS